CGWAGFSTFSAGQKTNTIYLSRLTRGALRPACLTVLDGFGLLARWLGLVEFRSMVEHKWRGVWRPCGFRRLCESGREGCHVGVGLRVICFPQSEKEKPPSGDLILYLWCVVPKFCFFFFSF
ncbi:unnamed protein product, partial [Sphacelaria rigidula]